MSGKYEVHNVYFEQTSIVIGYIEVPDDVRVEGALVMQHQLRLAVGHPDYGEDAVRLHDRVVKVLKNALEDFATSEPYDPPDQPEEDDDEKGMGE